MFIYIMHLWKKKKKQGLLKRNTQIYFLKASFEHFQTPFAYECGHMHIS